MSCSTAQGQLSVLVASYVSILSCPAGPLEVNYNFSIAFRVRIFSLLFVSVSFHCPARPLCVYFLFIVRQGRLRPTTSFQSLFMSVSSHCPAGPLLVSLSCPEGPLEVDGALGEAHDLRELAESTACCGANRKFILPLEMEEELDLREPGRSLAWCVASCPEPGPEPAVPLLMDAVHDKAGRSRPPICPQCPSRSCRDCRYATFQGCGARQGRQEPHESMDWRTQRATWTKHDQQKRTANLTDELSRQTNKIGNVGS